MRDHLVVDLLRPGAKFTMDLLCPGAFMSLSVIAAPSRASGGTCITFRSARYVQERAAYQTRRFALAALFGDGFAMTRGDAGLRWRKGQRGRPACWAPCRRSPARPGCVGCLPLQCLAMDLCVPVDGGDLQRRPEAAEEWAEHPSIGGSGQRHPGAARKCAAHPSEGHFG